MATKVTCRRCGADVGPGARFCPACGAPQADARREERRVVTVVFGDLAGFTELSERRDAEEVKAIIDRAFERLAAIINEHGGTVDKIIGDEIMAVFGAPQAHEDDPERAVRAALAMGRALADASVELERDRGIPLRMHFGINTGEVVAGFVGGSDSYTVVGDAVNTARRIAEAAEAGQVLVGEATVEASQDAIEYRALGHVSAKGKRLPVGVWEALAERGLPGERGPRAAPLIGRDEELALLDALTAIVRRDRRPIVATLIGDAGIGKSRLARSFAGRARAAGVRVLDGRSLAYGSAAPAFEVAEVLRAALGIAREAVGEDARTRLAERLEHLGMPGEVETLAAFLGLGGEVRGRTGNGFGAAGPAGEAATALEAARQALERVAADEGGLVLAFHDLHWGDDAVLDFVQGFMQGVRAPLLALCLSRPELLERRPHWGEPVGSVILSLEPLSPERAEEMLSLLAPSLPYAVRSTVLERAGGNPFYLEELARLFGARSAEALESVSVPGSIQALVAARLDALPDDLKRLVQDAAVVGETFWAGALRALGSEPAASLDSPDARELVEPADDGRIPGETAWRFRQTIVRDVAYGAVPKHLRAKHHAAVGSWLEEVATSEGGDREVFDLIAHHLERAGSLSREIGDPAPAVEAKARAYLERAGDHALAMDASRTAARFFERAVAFARDEADALTLRLRLGEALVGSWRHQEAVQELEQVLKDARALGGRAVEGRALRLLGDSYRMTGQAARAHEPIEQALAIAKELGDDAEEAAALRARGQLDLFQGRWQSSTLWFRQALTRYRAAGDRRGEAWSLQNLGWANMFIRRLDEARTYLEEGEAIFTELGDEEGAGWCRGMRGWVSLLLGDLDRAAQVATEVEAALRRHPEYLLGAGFALDLQRILRAYVEVLRAHLVAAEEQAGGAFESGDSIGASWVHALGRYPVFLAALLERRFDAAEAHVVAGMKGAAALGDPLYIGLTEFARAWLAVERGDLDRAEGVMERLTGEDDQGKLWTQSAGLTMLRAMLARARGDLAGALAITEEPGAARQRGIAMVSGAWVDVLRAEMLTEAGDAAAAVETATGALEAAGEEVVVRLLASRALASALLAAGSADEAERVIRSELMLLDETDWRAERIRALAVLARALDAQRRFDEAGEAQDTARALLDAASPDAETGALERMLVS